MGALLDELRRHRVPAWWTDAKFGVFIHWTPASVVGWAPTDFDIGEVLASGRPDALAFTPYTEWYENSLRFPDSPASRYHAEHHAGVSYRDLGERFDEGLSQWDPSSWARVFARAGARYVVLVTKHHDGYCLWPSAVSNPHRSGWHTTRDVVGELAEAVRGEGMRFGVYYSGGLDWTFDDRPLGSFADVIAACPRGGYLDYAEAQVRELIARYRPSVLWNDISWPTSRERLWELLAHYYRQVPDGVVNDRFLPVAGLATAFQLAPVRRTADAIAVRHAKKTRDQGMVPTPPPHYDVQTPEYTVFDDVRRRPFEVVRGMDLSFGYNRASTPEQFLSERELLGTLSDIAAKGGNLLLNVGPRGEDATIPAPQLDRLRWLADWQAATGGALSASRPWIRPAATSPDGVELRFVAHGDEVRAVCHGDVVGSITIPGVAPTPTTGVEVLVDGTRRPVTWHAAADGIRVDVAAGEPVHWPVVVLSQVDAR